ncbi:S-layer homology domain-containing protein [Caldicellulosiruptoraceae bacterium PP1]
MKRKMQKIFSMFLLFIFCINIFIPSVFASFSDTKGHWAESAIENLTKSKIINGYPDNTFKPQKSITRIEFASIINSIFKFNQVSNISFKDVSSNDWFYNQVKIAANYMNGYSDNTFRPNKAITRQEAVTILKKVFDLESTNNKNIAFKDENQIANYAKDAVNTLVTFNYIQGYKDNTFRPNGILTRAEAVTLISRLVSKIYNNKGSFNKETINGNAIVNTPDVELKDIIVKGNLYITEGVGEGTVTLDGVTVDGKLFVAGGGQNSIHLKNSKINEIKVAKQQSSVRLVAEGNTVIQKAIVVSNAKIEDNSNSNGFKSIVIENTSKEIKLELKGYIDNVSINGNANVVVSQDSKITKLESNSEKSKLEINGQVDEINISKADNIVINENAEIKTLNVKSDNSKLDIQGKVEKALIENAKEVNISKQANLKELVVKNSDTDIKAAGTIEKIVAEAPTIKINNQVVKNTDNIEIKNGSIAQVNNSTNDTSNTNTSTQQNNTAQSTNTGTNTTTTTISNTNTSTSTNNTANNNTNTGSSVNNNNTNNSNTNTNTNTNNNNNTNNNSNDNSNTGSNNNNNTNNNNNSNGNDNSNNNSNENNTNITDIVVANVYVDNKIISTGKDNIIKVLVKNSQNQPLKDKQVTILDKTYKTDDQGYAAFNINVNQSQEIVIKVDGKDYYGLLYSIKDTESVLDVYLNDLNNKLVDEYKLEIVNLENGNHQVIDSNKNNNGKTTVIIPVGKKYNILLTAQKDNYSYYITKAIEANGGYQELKIDANDYSQVVFNLTYNDNSLNNADVYIEDNNYINLFENSYIGKTNDSGKLTVIASEGIYNLLATMQINSKPAYFIKENISLKDNNSVTQNWQNILETSFKVIGKDINLNSEDQVDININGKYTINVDNDKSIYITDGSYKINEFFITKKYNDSYITYKYTPIKSQIVFNAGQNVDIPITLGNKINANIFDQNNTIAVKLKPNNVYNFTVEFYTDNEYEVLIYANDEETIKDFIPQISLKDQNKQEKELQVLNFEYNLGMFKGQLYIPENIQNGDYDFTLGIYMGPLYNDTMFFAYAPVNIDDGISNTVVATEVYNVDMLYNFLAHDIYYNLNEEYNFITLYDSINFDNVNEVMAGINDRLLKEYPAISDFGYDGFEYKISRLQNNKYLLAIKVKYIFNKEERLARRQQLENAINEFINKYLNNPSITDDHDKVLAIHDGLIKEVSYDWEGYNNNNISYDSYTAYGALVNKKAVCEGIAKAASLIFNRLGIQNIIIYGQATNGNTTDTHAWNAVKIDDSWYHVDITFDNLDQNEDIEIPRNYIFLTDDEISVDHTWNKDEYGIVCNNDKYSFVPEVIADPYLINYYQTSYNIKFKLINSKTKEPIANEQIEILGTTYTTNQNGEVEVTLDRGKLELGENKITIKACGTTINATIYAFSVYDDNKKLYLKVKYQSNEIDIPTDVIIKGSAMNSTNSTFQYLDSLKKYVATIYNFDLGYKYTIDIISDYERSSIYGIQPPVNYYITNQELNVDANNILTIKEINLDNYPVVDFVAKKGNNILKNAEIYLSEISNFDMHLLGKTDDEGKIRIIMSPGTYRVAIKYTEENVERIAILDNITISNEIVQQKELILNPLVNISLNIYGNELVIDKLKSLWFSNNGQFYSFDILNGIVIESNSTVNIKDITINMPIYYNNNFYEYYIYKTYNGGSSELDIDLSQYNITDIEFYISNIASFLRDNIPTGSKIGSISVALFNSMNDKITTSCKYNSLKIIDKETGNIIYENYNNYNWQTQLDIDFQKFTIGKTYIIEIEGDFGPLFNFTKVSKEFTVVQPTQSNNNSNFVILNLPIKYQGQYLNESRLQLIKNAGNNTMIPFSNTSSTSNIFISNNDLIAGNEFYISLLTASMPKDEQIYVEPEVKYFIKDVKMNVVNGSFNQEFNLDELPTVNFSILKNNTKLSNTKFYVAYDYLSNESNKRVEYYYYGKTDENGNITIKMTPGEYYVGANVNVNGVEKFVVFKPIIVSNEMNQTINLEVLDNTKELNINLYNFDKINILSTGINVNQNTKNNNYIFYSSNIKFNVNDLSDNRAIFNISGMDNNNLYYYYLSSNIDLSNQENTINIDLNNFITSNLSYVTFYNNVFYYTRTNEFYLGSTIRYITPQLIDQTNNLNTINIYPQNASIVRVIDKETNNVIYEDIYYNNQQIDLDSNYQVGKTYILELELFDLSLNNIKKFTTEFKVINYQQ